MFAAMFAYLKVGVAPAPATTANITWCVTVSKGPPSILLEYVRPPSRPSSAAASVSCTPRLPEMASTSTLSVSQSMARPLLSA